MYKMNEEILESVQVIISDAPVALLKYYISKASNFFLSTTNLTEIPTNAKSIIVDLVIIYFNKFGYEGLVNTSQNGISLNWGLDLPADIKMQLANFTCIKWV